MRLVVGLGARLFILVAVVAIVSHAAHALWSRGDEPIAVAAVVFFPVTLFLWPILGSGAMIVGVPLWAVLIGIFLAYPVSTVVGGLPPVDSPGQLFSPSTWVPDRFDPDAYWDEQEALLDDFEEWRRSEGTAPPRRSSAKRHGG